MNDTGNSIDFRLPMLRLESNRRAHSSTPVTWLDALKGHVEFVAWPEFENLVRDTVSEIDDMDAKKLEDARTFMNAARQKVKPNCSVYGIHGNKKNILSRCSRSQDSWDNYLPEWCKIADNGIRSALQFESLSNRRDERPTYSDESSLLSLCGYIFDVMQDVLQHTCGTRLLALRTKSVILGKPTHEQPKRRRKTRDKGTTDSPIITGITAVADKLISEEEERQGPDQNQYRSPSNEERTPDFTLMLLKKDRDSRGQPVCAFELKGPRIDLCALGTKATETDAKSLETRFNHIFRRDEDNDEGDYEGENEGETKVFEEKDEIKNEGQPKQMDAKEVSVGSRKPIAQALTYALSVASGCSFLYNYRQGIALKLLDMDEQTGKIRFLVSRSFYPGNNAHNETFGPLEAMLTLCIHSVRRISKYNSLPKYVERVANGVSDIYKSSKQVGGINKESNLKRTASEAGAFGSLQASKKSRGNEGNECQGLYRRNDREDEGSSSSDGSTFFEESSVVASPSKRKLTLNDLQKVKTVRTLGDGFSGNVLLGNWDGTGIAVKVWNRRSKDGLFQMYKEIDILRLMQFQTTSLLGRAVPDLLLTWSGNRIPEDDECDCDEIGSGALLVTEFAGHEIYRGEEGTLYVVEGESAKAIDSLEEKYIFQAAMNSLNAIHGEGFIHGDIALQNLRVEQQRSDQFQRSGRSMWSAWWIDFGQATFVSEARSSMRSSFKMEKRDCMCLFIID